MSLSVPLYVHICTDNALTYLYHICALMVSLCEPLKCPYVCPYMSIYAQQCLDIPISYLSPIVSLCVPLYVHICTVIPNRQSLGWQTFTYLFHLPNLPPQPPPPLDHPIFSSLIRPQVPWLPVRGGPGGDMDPPLHGLAWGRDITCTSRR